MMRSFRYCVLQGVFSWFLVLGSTEVSAQVWINELLASNSRSIVDEDEDTSDALELYNAGPETVDLNGYGLTDDEAEPHQWVFPELRLDPGGFLVVFCSNKDRVVIDENGTFAHTSFKLSSGGEKIALTDPRGVVVDSVEFPRQATDRSYGRHPDGTGEFQYMLFPSLGEPNDSHVSSESIPARLLSFDPQSGKYSDDLLVTISASGLFEGFEVRYTLTGSPPTAASELYVEPIPVNEDTVVRAVAVLDGRVDTDIVTKSYFGLIRVSSLLNLPVMSISLDPKEFQDVHLKFTGYGREWEREGHMEIFNKDGTPAKALGFGIRLHGGSGREGDMTTKKAYRAYFRGVYGASKLKYPLIPDTEVEEFDKLVLRSNFSDSFRRGGSYIRDQVARDLHEQLGATVSHGTWYNLLINMEYRGVYNVCERIEAEFFASYFSDDGDNWDVMKSRGEVTDGDNMEWRRLATFLRENDLREESAYEEAQRLIDVENYTNYIALNLWIDSNDWPGNNWHAARPRRPDGKWTFQVWDAENSFGHRSKATDAFRRILRSDVPMADIFNGLIKNRRYQVFFLEVIEKQAATVLQPDNTIEKIMRHVRAIGPDMPRELGLFDNIASTTWRSHIQAMQRFANQRSDLVRDFILASDGLTIPVATSVTPAKITVNGVTDVTFSGFRFTESTEVFFEKVPAAKIEYVSPNELTVGIPFDSSLGGTPQITLVDPVGGEWSGGNLIDITLGDAPTFRRGDADGNGRPNITDAVQILQYLFRAPNAQYCDDAMDVDDSGKVNLTDAVFLLGYLLRPDSPVPPTPLVDCGPDPTEDGITCVGATGCE